MQDVSTKTLTIAIALTLASAVSALGESGPSLSDDGVVLHELLPPPPGERASIPVFVYDPLARGGQPREFQRDGVSYPAPSSTASSDDADPRYAAEGLAGSGSEGSRAARGAAETHDPRGSLGSEALPDRDTEKEGTISYHASFDPSVVPFKRNRALDRVSTSGSMTIAAGAMSKISVEGVKADPSRDVFWGSVLLEGRRGDTIPLPSVAAESRILSIEVTPSIPLSFFRDQADNLYVRPLVEGEGSVRARLVFLMDAPKSYFGRSLPSGLTLEDIPKARRPKLPASMRGSTRDVVEALGLSGATDYRQTLGTLVQHFRSFEPGSPPADSGDLYTDLALSKRGICRHRSYAFVVTAQALGIPSRYVFNEAHVFVEVWVPGERPGWMRIDLGGSAERLEIGGAEDKVRHEADEPDPFDRPLPFARSTRGGPSAGASTVVGLPPTRRPDAAERDLPSAPERTGLLPPPAALTVSPDASPTRTTLTILSPVVYRGEPFDIEGSVSAQGQVRPSGTVQLLLVDATNGSTLGLLQTVALSAEGTYTASLTIPGAQPPGAYELVAEYMGDTSSAPSRSP